MKLPAFQPPAGATAVERLQKALRLLEEQRQPGSLADNLQSLEAAWRMLDAPVRAHEDDGFSAGRIWSGLAVRPEGKKLFALRDAAAREVLKGVTAKHPDTAAPLATDLEDALEEMIGRENLDAALRLLALDRACGALSQQVHQEYARGVSWLIDRRPRGAGDGELEARRMIFETSSAALRLAAARALQSRTKPK